MASNKLTQSRGLRVSYFDNQLLHDPRVWFAEKWLVAFEQELGEEGKNLQNVEGLRECLDLFCQINGFGVHA
jgi:hypothetical protein